MAKGRGKLKVKNFFSKIKKRVNNVRAGVKKVFTKRNGGGNAEANQEDSGLLDKMQFAKQESLPMGGAGAAQINQNQGEGAAKMDALGVVEKIAGVSEAVGGVIRSLKGGDADAGGNGDAEPGGAGGSEPTEKKPFYKTPIGIAAIAGGALLLIGGIYMAVKKK
jgi:hypothetical protein